MTLDKMFTKNFQCNDRIRGKNQAEYKILDK